MFGYVRPFLPDLSEEESRRYRAVYCGVCRSLGRRFGSVCQLSVNYDLTFLALLLSSLYEPEEEICAERCLPHPAKAREKVGSAAVDYAADMTVALTYFKCLDDWQDEKKYPQRMYASLLKRHFDSVAARWPGQCAAIQDCIEQLHVIEGEERPSPDAGANCFGRLMEGLFLWKNDFWAGQLKWFGRSLGRFIYLMDAAMDFDEDRKKGCYNPLVLTGVEPEKARELLMQPLGEASAAFEGLPLVQDAHLMRSILYSGVWQAYNESMEKKTRQTGGKADGP